VSKDTVYRWLDHRDMPGHKVGRAWKFKISEVDEWVRDGNAGEK
jgi:excisionase family DNA binding protein